MGEVPLKCPPPSHLRGRGVFLRVLLRGVVGVLLLGVLRLSNAVWGLVLGVFSGSVSGVKVRYSCKVVSGRLEVRSPVKTFLVAHHMLVSAPESTNVCQKPSLTGQPENCRSN